MLHSIAFVATFWEAFFCCLRNVRHRSGAVSMSLTEDSLWPSESRNSAVSLVGVGVLLSTAGDEAWYVAAYPAPAPGRFSRPVRQSPSDSGIGGGGWYAESSAFARSASEGLTKECGVATYEGVSNRISSAPDA